MDYNNPESPFDNRYYYISKDNYDNNLLDEIDWEANIKADFYCYQRFMMEVIEQENIEIKIYANNNCGRGCCSTQLIFNEIFTEKKK